MPTATEKRAPAKKAGRTKDVAAAPQRTTAKDASKPKSAPRKPAVRKPAKPAKVTSAKAKVAAAKTAKARQTALKASASKRTKTSGRSGKSTRVEPVEPPRIVPRPQNQRKSASLMDTVPQPKRTLSPNDPGAASGAGRGFKPAANEPYMSDRAIAFFRGQLLAELDNRKEDEGKSLGFIKSETTNLPDVLDQASQEEKMALQLRSHIRSSKKESKILESLKLLDTGEFGYCEECGTEIGLARLLARPTATYCIDCKNIQEAKERYNQR